MLDAVLGSIPEKTKCLPWAIASKRGTWDPEQFSKCSWPPHCSPWLQLLLGGQSRHTHTSSPRKSPWEGLRTSPCSSQRRTGQRRNRLVAPVAWPSASESWRESPPPLFLQDTLPSVLCALTTEILASPNCCPSSDLDGAQQRVVPSSLSHSPSFFLKKIIYLFIYFRLRWVFVATCGLSLVASSGSYSSLRCVGLSLPWLLSWSTGSRCSGLVAPRHVGSSRTRAQTRVPCIGRRFLNLCTTRGGEFSWIWFASTLLRIFASMFIKKYWSVVFFFLFL